MYTFLQIEQRVYKPRPYLKGEHQKKRIININLGYLSYKELCG